MGWTAARPARPLARRQSYGGDRTRAKTADLTSTAAEAGKLVARDVQQELELISLREERGCMQVTLRSQKKSADQRAEQDKDAMHKVEQRLNWTAAALAAYKDAVEVEVGDGKNEELWKLSQKHVTAQAARDSHAMVERWERGL